VASLREVGRADGIAAVRRLSGGVIADAWLITWADGTSAVGKIVSGAAPDLFRAEADGLAALRGTGHLATPDVLAVTGRLLLLEALVERRPDPRRPVDRQPGQPAGRPDHRHRPGRVLHLGRGRPVHAVEQRTPVRL